MRNGKKEVNTYIYIYIQKETDENKKKEIKSKKRNRREDELYIIGKEETEIYIVEKSWHLSPSHKQERTRPMQRRSVRQRLVFSVLSSSSSSSLTPSSSSSLYSIRQQQQISHSTLEKDREKDWNVPSFTGKRRRGLPLFLYSSSYNTLYPPYIYIYRQILDSTPFDIQPLSSSSSLFRLSEKSFSLIRPSL